MGSHIPSENMIPLGKNPEYDAKIRAKIKGSASERRKIAQSLSHLKFIKDDKKREARLLELVRNPEASALQIQGVIEQMLEKENLTPRTKIELIGKVVQAHTAIHGLRTKNLNINIDMTSNKVLERLKEIKKEETELKVIIKDGNTDNN